MNEETYKMIALDQAQQRRKLRQPLRTLCSTAENDSIEILSHFERKRFEGNVGEDTSAAGEGDPGERLRGREGGRDGDYDGVEGSADEQVEDGAVGGLSSVSRGNGSQDGE